MSTAILKSLFAVVPDGPRGVTAGARAAAARISVMSADGPGGLAEVCSRAAWDMADGDRLLVTFDMGGGNHLGRAIGLLTLPLRLAKLERALARCGCSTRRYSVEPTLTDPSIVIELGGVASDYAASHLLNHGPRFARVRAALRWWLSCDPSAGGIVLVARR